MTQPSIERTRTTRLLTILLLLQARGRASARQIAEHLGVSLRTVYRDVQALNEAGVPLYAEPGRTGGYRLVDGYRTTLTGLTEQESLALFLVGLPTPAASLGLGQAAVSVETKLLAALGARHRQEATRLRDRFLLDLPPWYAEAETPPVLRDLAGAVLTNQQIQIGYRRWREPRQVHRVLDPHGLVIKNGQWYLAAIDRTKPSRSRAAPRVYRVSNILQLHVADETFERLPGFDLARFWHTHLADFDRRRLSVIARIRLAPSLIEQLPDLDDRGLSNAVAAGTIDADQWHVVAVPIESPTKGAAHLVRYGGQIEVLEPAELREELLALARAVLRTHIR